MTLHQGTRFLLTVTLILLTASLFGQNTGYIVRLSGDTVRGSFPRYRSQERNPTQVQFSDGTTTQRFGSQDIRGFGIDGGDQYLAYRGPRLTNITNVLASSGYTGRETYDTISVFLRAFAHQGNTTFYAYGDALRVNLFYSTNGAAPVELKEAVTVDDNGVLHDAATYRQQLAQLTGAPATDLPYTEEAVTRWIGTKKGGTTTYTKGRHQGEGFVLQVGVSKASFRSTEGSVTTDYEGKASLFAGVGYLLRFNHGTSRSFLLPQVSYSTYEASASKQGRLSGETVALEAKGSAIGLGLHLGYHFFEQAGISVFATLGADAQFYGTHTLAQRYQYDASFPFVHQPDETLEQAKVTIAPKVQVGTDIHRFWIWAAYMLSSSPSQSDRVGSSLRSLQAGVGYRF